MIRPAHASAKFRPGQLVRHKRYGYRGVVVDHDPFCKAPDSWYLKNQTQPSPNQPWYHVLVDGSSTATYAAQTSLVEDDRVAPVAHPLVPVFFSEFDGQSYLSNDQPWPKTWDQRRRFSVPACRSSPHILWCGSSDRSSRGRVNGSAQTGPARHRLISVTRFKSIVCPFCLWTVDYRMLTTAISYMPTLGTVKLTVPASRSNGRLISPSLSGLARLTDPARRPVGRHRRTLTFSITLFER